MLDNPCPLSDGLRRPRGVAAGVGLLVLWVRKAHILRRRRDRGSLDGRWDALLSSEDKFDPFLHFRMKKMPRFPWEGPEALPGEFPSEGHTC